MMDDSYNGERATSIGFRDVLMNMLFGMMAIIMTLVLLQKAEEARATAQSEPAGNITAKIDWPAGDTDVDLWVSGPGEPVPVGYSNKGGLLWNLLRDDLGNWPDATPYNNEFATTHGIIAGIYTVNVMCYTCRVFPVPVDVEISLNTGAGKKGDKTPTKVLFSVHVVLTKPGQERTAISFKIDANGNVDDKYTNSIFRPLRSAKKG